MREALLLWWLGFRWGGGRWVDGGGSIHSVRLSDPTQLQYAAAMWGSTPSTRRTGRGRSTTRTGAATRVRAACPALLCSALHRGLSTHQHHLMDAIFHTRMNPFNHTPHRLVQEGGEARAGRVLLPGRLALRRRVPQEQARRGGHLLLLQR